MYIHSLICRVLICERNFIIIIIIIISFVLLLLWKPINEEF